MRSRRATLALHPVGQQVRPCLTSEMLPRIRPCIPLRLIQRMLGTIRVRLMVAQSAPKRIYEPLPTAWYTKAPYGEQSRTLASPGRSPYNRLKFDIQREGSGAIAEHVLPRLEEVRAEIEAVVNPLGRAAAVTFNSHITGLAVARSLGSRGVPVIALDRDIGGVGLYSRHTLVSGICPNPIADEEAFVAYLEAVGQVLERPAVLFPTNDEWVLAVSRHRARLERYFVFPFSPQDVVEPVLNKTSLYKTAERLGIPIPRTWYLSEQPAEDVAGELPFPCVVKPAEQRLYYDRFGEKLRVVDDAPSFLAAVREAEGLELLAQEMVPTGPDSFYSLCSYVSRNGEPGGLFVGRKQAQYPPFSGTACLVDARWTPEVAERGATILREFGYQGISETEFLYDVRDGEYKLLDLNTRVWKWIGLPIRCGVDLPWLAYSDVVMGKAETSRPVLDGLQWVHIRDYMHLQRESPNGLSAELSPEGWLALVAGEAEVSEQVTDAVLVPSDPAPFVRLLQSELQRSRYYCAC